MLEAQEERLEQALDRANRADGAANVLEQDEAAAGPQHPVGLADRRAVVGDRAKRQRAGHGVEALIVERERLDVSFSQLDPAGDRGSLALREGQHRRAELDPGEVDPGWV